MKKKIVFVLMLAMYAAFYATKNPVYLVLFFIAAGLYFLISMIFYNGAF